jgi:hypothetical protein
LIIPPVLSFIPCFLFLPPPFLSFPPYFFLHSFLSLLPCSFLPFFPCFFFLPFCLCFLSPLGLPFFFYFLLTLILRLFFVSVSSFNKIIRCLVLFNFSPHANGTNGYMRNAYKNLIGGGGPKRKSVALWQKLVCSKNSIFFKVA